MCKHYCWQWWLIILLFHSEVVLVQAPVPYMNRALAKEALGVEAANSGDKASASQLFEEALQVSCTAPLLSQSQSRYLQRDGQSKWRRHHSIAKVFRNANIESNLLVGLVIESTRQFNKHVFVFILPLEERYWP